MSLTKVSGAAKEDLVVSLAILALHDGGVEINADNINNLVNATNNKVASYWGAIYSKILANRDIDDLLLKPGVGGGAAVAVAAGGAAPAAGGAPAAEEKKEEEEEEEVGGAGGLFGGDDDW